MKYGWRFLDSSERNAVIFPQHPEARRQPCTYDFILGTEETRTLIFIKTQADEAMEGQQYADFMQALCAMLYHKKAKALKMASMAFEGM